MGQSMVVRVGRAPLALVVVAAAPLAVAQEPEAWHALRLPSLCIDVQAAPRLPRLDHGQHIVLEPWRELEPQELAPRPVLPVPALLELLREDARRNGSTLRLSSGAPPLLAQGPQASIDSLRALLAELEAAGDALFVDLEVWLTAGASGAGTYPVPAALESATRGGAPWARARSRSGETLALGARTHTSFLASYQVETAEDAGIAAPLAGQTLTGETLHLRACRVRGGRELHIEGLFDRTLLLERRAFDTQSLDLGRIEQPVMSVVQVAFSGVVPSRGLLAVEASGAAATAGSTESGGGFTLWIRATTRPDVEALTWRVLDLALLETPARELLAVEPGAGLDGLSRGRDRPRSMEPLTAAAAAQIAESAPRATGRQRPLVVWAPGLLLAPRAEQATWAAIEELVSVAEQPRLESQSIAVTHGELAVRLPLTAAAPARVLVGHESTVLAEYDVRISAESWMPVPRPGRTFDGLVLEACLRDDGLALEAWIAATEALQELSCEDTGLARLQLPQRSFHGGSSAIPRSATALSAVEVVPRTQTVPELRVEASGR
jgi:hypothetical protein